MLHKIINCLFVKRDLTSAWVIGVCTAICFFISGNVFAETSSFQNEKVWLNSDSVYGYYSQPPVFNLEVKSEVDIFSKIVEFFSLVSSKTEPVTEKKPKKEGYETYDIRFQYPLPIVSPRRTFGG